MSKVSIIKLAKEIKKIVKTKEKHYVSYCRRIERIKTDRRICAMTFDDGPTYDSNITATLVETLNSFGAKGTFDVIGTTGSNYPDQEGKMGTPAWSGTTYDHYPKYGADKNGGAVNCPDLIDLILDNGHEITNHTYSHVLFGKKNIIYSKRHTLNNFDEVYADIKKLHDHMIQNHSYHMQFSRPPHYVDKTADGLTAYDAYAKIGYNYLAASFDGAGWLPCENEEAEIKAMVSPIENALNNDPDSLCGQIIFQKDGYNMALRAPVKEGLRFQLELLKKYGYEIVTVSELLKESPFADVGTDDTDIDVFKNLIKDHAIAYSDNTLRPDNIMTKGELAMLIAPRDISVESRISAMKAPKNLLSRTSPKAPYYAAIQWCIDNRYFMNTKSQLTKEDIQRCSVFFDTSKITDLKRRTILKAFKQAK